MKVWKRFLALGLTAGLLAGFPAAAAAEEIAVEEGTQEETAVLEETAEETAKEQSDAEEMTVVEADDQEEGEDIYLGLDALLEDPDVEEEELLGAITPEMIKGEWKGIIQGSAWNTTNGQITNFKVRNRKATLDITSCTSRGSISGTLTLSHSEGTIKLRISGSYNFSTGKMTIKENSIISNSTGSDFHKSDLSFDMEPDRMMMRSDRYTPEDPIKTRIFTSHLYKTDYTSGKPVDMMRLYSPASGEHFYTGNSVEAVSLTKIGWKYEGHGWRAPSRGDMVYRMYNSIAGEHHYTTNYAELDTLSNAGWSFEGIGWFSDPKRAVKLYREYNPNAFANNHNYTTSKEEHDWLISLGWKNEGTAWYGVK